MAFTVRYDDISEYVNVKPQRCRVRSYCVRGSRPFELVCYSSPPPCQTLEASLIVVFFTTSSFLLHLLSSFIPPSLPHPNLSLPPSSPLFPSLSSPHPSFSYSSPSFLFTTHSLPPPLSSFTPYSLLFPSSYIVSSITSQCLLTSHVCPQHRFESLAQLIITCTRDNQKHTHTHKKS